MKRAAATCCVAIALVVACASFATPVAAQTLPTPPTIPTPKPPPAAVPLLATLSGPVWLGCNAPDVALGTISLVPGLAPLPFNPADVFSMLAPLLILFYNACALVPTPAPLLHCTADDPLAAGSAVGVPGPAAFAARQAAALETAAGVTGAPLSSLIEQVGGCVRPTSVPSIGGAPADVPLTSPSTQVRDALFGAFVPSAGLDFETPAPLVGAPPAVSNGELASSSPPAANPIDGWGWLWRLLVLNAIVAVAFGLISMTNLTRNTPSLHSS